MVVGERAVGGLGGCDCTAPVTFGGGFVMTSLSLASFITIGLSETDGHM